ncbi:hemerythrin domain-containing protein [Pararhizobium haloflavum]|uniref:hemerythrin domain-containing protein n=1 Tax=Pararhizobium haloflavum TaxID=2037914 RepID=UPI000C1A783A|nr:hemerythrin domain-containing protein [Pararhizobium haloflavum]
MSDETLYARSGLPDDLRVLLAKYPREGWHRDHTIGQTGSFWLQRHDMFRELGRALVTTTNDLKEGRMAPDAFAGWFVPRLNFFLSQLEGHHQIEDQHYFPAFAAADPRLKRGFDILDSDHHLIHDLLKANAHAARGFLEGLRAGGDQLKRASEDYGQQAERLLAGLLRHLEDEEDLIIPLMIDRGEDRLGLY